MSSSPAPAIVSPVSGRHARLLLVFLLPLLTFHAGCASARRVTFPDWQSSVVKYVKEEGEGRPSVLRDVTIRGGRRGFAVLGDPRPDKAQDVVGLLLAHRSVAGRPSFIYLVALVARQQVRDIRLATLSDQDGQLRWRLSPTSEDARRAYLEWRRSRWTAVYPDRTNPPLSYQGFPLEEDAFDVTVGENEIAAEHPASGARWTLAITGGGGAAAASAR